jgi:DNA (cytosine-5)-methyltransferase 1
MDSQGDAEQPLVVIDLSDFEIYRSPGPERNEYELTSLHHFDIKTRNLQLSGVLTLGNARHFVDQVRIETYSIQGYNVDDDPNTVVYVRSHQASRDPTFDVWFRLGKSCARSYRRFHEPFVWVADLGKHVIDYISSKGNSSVGLDDFRSSFFQWLHRRYQNSAHFSSWIGAYEKRDFRIPVNAYIDYLYGQAYNLPNSKQLLKHNLWAECSKGEGRAIQNQPIICEHTIATPLVYRCFRGMYFGKFLAEKEPRQAIRERQETRKTSLGFAVDSPGAEFLAPNHPLPPLTTSLDFEVGDVVSVNREKGIWKTHDEEWLGYIQRIETLPKAGLRLFLIWLYRPTDTPIDSMVYPISKEMFLSDHCNCDEAPIHSTDVIRKYAVDWNPKNLHTEKDVLVRQKYVIEDKAWITLKASDYECDCMRSKERRSISYQPGDCVYIKKSHQGRPSLEPVVISRVCETSDEIIVRQLLRASRDCSNISSSFRRHTAAANEVVWTNEHFKVRTHHIERKCHIRFFLLEDVVSCRVPTPYDRGGNGDFWYLSTAVTIVNSKKCLSALGEAPSPMVQGFDPASTPWTPLRALSLFSGGGNLDRGLEDGGAVRFQNAVDISEGAILTQRANATHVKDLDLYWGSVDDYLKAVLKGKTNSGIARIGDIQFIAAGSVSIYSRNCIWDIH